MSFVRFGRQQQQHTKAKRNSRPKRPAPPKKEWVSTVNDLSVHKLTPAELDYRHEMMKSHNKVAAQWELREKILKRRLRHGSPSPLDETSLSIIKEVLSDQMLLQDVLARSDRAMSVVKDIFGDAPRRQTGHLNVTKAPNGNSNSIVPVFQRPDPPTELSLLSQSMMNSQALNDLEYSDDCDENTSGCLNVDVIRRANVHKMKSRATEKVVRKQKINSIPATPRLSDRGPDPAALNATVAVQRVRRSHNQAEESQSNDREIISQVLNPEQHSGHSGSINCSMRKTKKCADRSAELDGSSFASLSGNQSSLDLLQTMLGHVEAELDSFSTDSKENLHLHKANGLTGFSVALVSTLGRLVHLFKQSNAEWQKAASERRQFEEEIKKQQGLIETFKAENAALREETAAFQSRMEQKISEMEEKVDTVVLILGTAEMPCIPTTGLTIPTTGLSGVVPERDDGQTLVTPAMQLLAPKQRDHLSHCSETHPVPGVLLHSPENISSLQSNLVSMPSTSPVSLSPLSSRLSAEAMMAEIAQISRENELIKAQLSQTKSYVSGSASPSSSYLEERQLNYGSRGTSPGVVERRTSGSSHHRSVELESEQQAETSLLNMSSVEQRLLELNRQSAEARARLLEIIDQQKNNVSTKPPPSASPVPDSAISPVPDRRSCSELSQLQEPMLESKQAASEEPSPSQSLRGTASDKVTKDTKQNPPEGWFSLSTHLR